MSPFNILISSLIIIPLTLKFNLFPLLPDTIVDYRICKNFLACGFTGLIAVMTINKKGISPQINKWPAILIGYLIIHHYLVPALEFSNRTDQMVINLWEHLPLVYAFIYYLFFLSVQDICAPQKHKETILKTLTWVSIISSIYLILQFFNLDEFQKLRIAEGIRDVEAANLTSFFTHPNFAGSFLALCVPFAIYLRKKLIVALLMLCVFLTHSSFPILAMLGGIVFYGAFRFDRNKRIIMWVALIAILASINILLVRHIIHIPSDHGRYYVWINMLDDIQRMPIFGYGFGSFPILFGVWHPTIFQEAHNELLQFTFECGLVGLFLLVAAIWDIIREAIKYFEKNEIILALTSSFVIILISSMGQPIWQVESHRYLSVLIIGMIISSTNQRRVLR